MSDSKKYHFWIIVVVAVLCGLSAGVLGEIITRVYFLKDFSVPYLSSDLNINDLNSNRSNLVIRDAKKVVVNEDVKIGETLSSLKPSLVGIFKEAATSTSAAVKNNYYQLDKPFLTGLVITADGWVMVSVPAELKKDFNYKNLVVITADRRNYKIDKINILNNVPGDLYLIHLNSASNLAIKKNITRSDLSLGQSLLVVKDSSRVLPTSLISIDKGQKILSSDSLDLQLTLAGNIPADFKNSFVFNLNGDLVAVINGAGNVVSVFAYDSYLQNVLKKNPSFRPYLGVNYLDLTNIKPISLSLEKGAWLLSSEDKLAVLKDSPAQSAGLKEGDVISWVNNQEINSANDLADIIATYKSGDSITITYWRNDQEQEAKVVLGQLK
ncbi:MAG: S1C family serine protease [Patescibacteria group bacterium]